ncbi:hypothetical protein PFTANZ_06224 [Plasmodium falciparum Tanzania (2000708)]|uniref:Uncharacterized protein n=1 Tax=Plasmodium falciparum Tanzania (2000708) TaxID=1036725 RepID=A0A024VYR2_PLAFA|nr:hypothetical protein PFTANZ_06224 [Plasmodium falciparum Tanzania (2000708)]
MKYHCVEYYSEENNTQNTKKDRSILINIIICNTGETMDETIFHIYRRYISQLESIKHNNIPCDSQGCNSEDNVNFSDTTTEEKYNNINYNDLSK